METVHTDGFSMDYLRFGHGKRDLVILPGLSVQSVMGLAPAVEQAYQPLAEAFTLRLFDRRKDLPAASSIADMARDTLEVLRALKLEHVCLFGVSMGGMIALEMALQDPKRIDRLALGSSAARVTETLRRTVQRWEELAEAGDARGLYLAFGEAVYPPANFAEFREGLVRMAQSVTPQELRRFAVQVRAIEDFDVTEKLPGIACPLLVLSARDDHVLGEGAEKTLSGRLGGRKDYACHVYEGYGHAAYDLAPDYKERLLRFFSD